jgi:hypothetical protein
MGIVSPLERLGSLLSCRVTRTCSRYLGCCTTRASCGDQQNEQADRYHLIQTLTGDVTDGYSGCPGIGPVKAELLCATAAPQSLVAVRCDAFKKAKLTEADALLQARLARILRNTEWDFDKSEVKLWSQS